MKAVVVFDLKALKFSCDYDRCNSRCCRSGRYVPLAKGERRIIEGLLLKVQGQFPSVNTDFILSNLTEERMKSIPKYGCPLLVQIDGKYRCSLQMMYDKGLIGFVKPLSCRLYPLQKHRNQYCLHRCLYFDYSVSKGIKENVKLMDFVGVHSDSP